MTRADIEGFVQNALLKVLDNLTSFRGESRFTTWAQKIASSQRASTQRASTKPSVNRGGSDGRMSPYEDMREVRVVNDSVGDVPIGVLWVPGMWSAVGLVVGTFLACHGPGPPLAERGGVQCVASRRQCDFPRWLDLVIIPLGVQGGADLSPTDSEVRRVSGES